MTSKLIVRSISGSLLLISWFQEIMTIKLIAWKVSQASGLAAFLSSVALYPRSFLSTPCCLDRSENKLLELYSLTKRFLTILNMEARHWVLMVTEHRRISQMGYKADITVLSGQCVGSAARPVMHSSTYIHNRPWRRGHASYRQVLQEHRELVSAGQRGWSLRPAWLRLQLHGRPEHVDRAEKLSCRVQSAATQHSIEAGQHGW